MKIGLLILTLVLIASSAKAEDCDFIKFNQCHSCDAPSSFNVGSDETCSFLCPNRKVNYEGSGSQVTNRNCALKVCPNDFPFQSSYGNCYATQAEAENDYGASQEENFSDDDIRSGLVSTALKIIDGKCPESHPLWGSKSCFSCDELDDLSISEDECAKCPNRVYKVYPKWDQKKCELPCPADQPLRRWDGKCFSCDESKVVGIETHCNIEHDCEICPNRTVVYWIGGNIPSVPNCPADKPLMDSEGICYACDVPVPVGVDWNTHFCSRFCPNERHLEGNNCVLNG